MKLVEIESGKHIELGVSGFDEIDNDPSKVMEYCLQQVHSLIKEGVENKGLPYSKDESGVIQLKPYRRVPEIRTLLGIDRDFVDIERTERFKTMMLEMAFISGDKQMINNILGRSEN